MLIQDDNAPERLKLSRDFLVSRITKAHILGLNDKVFNQMCD